MADLMVKRDVPFQLYDVKILDATDDQLLETLQSFQDTCISYVG